MKKENIRMTNQLKRDQEIVKFQKIVEAIESVLTSTIDRKDTDGMIILVGDLLLKLDKQLEAYCDAHRRHMSSLSAIDERERESKWLDGCLDIFHKTHTKGKLFCHKRIHHSSSGIGNSHKLEIKKLDFDSFDGDIRRYPRFKEQFIKHVKRNYRAEEEAFVLRSFLSKDIKDEIDNLGKDAKKMWERLDHKYGDVGKLIDAILSDFKTIRKCDNSNPMHTVKLINVIERAHRDLLYLDKVGEINNATIIGIIEQKLPEEIETEWIKMITGNEKEAIQKDKFPYLLKLLVQFRERIEYKHASLRSSLNSRSREQLNFNVQDTIDDSNNRRVW